MFNINLLTIYFILLTLIIKIKCYPEINSNQNDINDNNIKNNEKISVLNDLSWDCANNSTCINLTIKNWIKLYKNNALLNFGLFSVEKNSPAFNSGRNNINDKSFYDDTSTGRAVNKIMNFLNGNAIRVPFGPMVFRLKRSEDSDDYLELALLKKVPYTEGRGRNRRQGMREKKQMQMFIPMYLAATTFGWTLVAIKAVGVLTIKALIVSKFAFLVAAGIIVKKLMDTASEKMLMTHHPQYMMPYSMDYGITSAHSEISPHDFYNLHYGHPHVAASGYETMAAAESNNHPVEFHLHSVQNNASQIQAQPQQQPHQHPHSQIVPPNNNNINQPLIVQNKIKRNDQWFGGLPTKSMLYNYLPSNTPPMYIYRK